MILTKKNMKNENLNLNETPADVKPVLSDSYFCRIDSGNGNSHGAFTVFKGGKLVWYTRKMWKAKLYVWWKRIRHNVTVLREQK